MRWALYMNDFTKEELVDIFDAVDWWLKGDCSASSEALVMKIQSMIDNYSYQDAKGIAKAHLEQAESLISHAMVLLRMDDDNP